MGMKAKGKGKSLPAFPKHIEPANPNGKRGKGIGRGPNGRDSFDDKKGGSPTSKY